MLTCLYVLMFCFIQYLGYKHNYNKKKFYSWPNKAEFVSIVCYSFLIFYFSSHLGLGLDYGVRLVIVSERDSVLSQFFFTIMSYSNRKLVLSVICLTISSISLFKLLSYIFSFKWKNMATSNGHWMWLMNRQYY